MGDNVNMLPLDEWFNRGPGAWFNLYVLAADTTGFSDTPVTADAVRTNSTNNLAAVGQVCQNCILTINIIIIII